MRVGQSVQVPTASQAEDYRQLRLELCGHSFSASAISGFNKKLDEELGRFTRRQLER